MDDDTLPGVLLETQQEALLALLAGLEMANPLVRPTLVQGFLDELSRHVKGLERGLFPAIEQLSLGARLKLDDVKAEHKSMLRDFARLRPELLMGTAPLRALRGQIESHLRRERALLEPMLHRLTWVHEAASFTLDPALRVTHWSPLLARLSGLTLPEVLGRRLEEVESRLDGGSRLSLVLPGPAGVTVWYPPWTERPGRPDSGRLRALLREPFPATLRPGLEAGLADLRGTLKAASAALFLLHPHDERVMWPAFTTGTWESPGLARQAAEQGFPVTSRAEGSQVWVPLCGLDRPLGAVGLRWQEPDAWLETALTLLLWAAGPLTLAVEPLVDSLRHPGHSPLSPGRCARVLGLP